MKKLLSWCGTSLVISAFIDVIIQWGLEQPIPWGRDFLMLCAGVFCIFLLVKFRDQL
jgi:hypothetical protein